MSSDETQRDREITRLTEAVFGTAGSSGLQVQLDRITRDFDRHIEHNEELWLNVAPLVEWSRDNPLMAQMTVRRVVTHVEEADHSAAARSRWWSLISTQMVVLAFGMIQTLMLGWIALKLGIAP